MRRAIRIERFLSMNGKRTRLDAFSPPPETWSEEAHCASRLTIVEPCEFVGETLAGQGICASRHLQTILKTVTGDDVDILRLWHDPCVPEDVLASSDCVFLEGGTASAYERDHPAWGSLVDGAYERFVQGMVLSEARHKSVVAICLSHQVLAQALLNVACDAVEYYGRFGTGRACDALLQSVCRELRVIAEELRVWRGLACKRNECSETGETEVFPYEVTHAFDTASESLRKLILCHRLVAEHSTSRLDQIIRERAITVPMFHNDEVAELPLLFANYVFVRLREHVDAWRDDYAFLEDARTLFALPRHVEIVASTKLAKEVLAEVAAYVVSYHDDAHKAVFSMQFHPELSPGIEVFDHAKLREELTWQTHPALAILFACVQGQ